MMSALQKPVSNAEDVLAKALFRASEPLGLTQEQLGQCIGKSRSAIYRIRAEAKLNPQEKAGELAVLLIKVYRCLFTLFGGDQQQMQHWMNTHNQHLQGVPATLVTSVLGLVQVSAYLEAIRNRT